MQQKSEISSGLMGHLACASFRTRLKILIGSSRSYSICALHQLALILFSELSKLFASGVVGERGCEGGVRS